MKEPTLMDVSTQPYRFHPPIPHKLEEFGCTVCHRGQGAATSVQEAHDSALIATAAFRGAVESKARDVRNAMADLSHFLSERLSALRPIRFHRTEDEERERLSTENRRLSRAVVRYQLLDSAVTGAPGLLLTLALAWIYLLGGRLLQHDVRVAAAEPETVAHRITKAARTSLIHQVERKRRIRVTDVGRHWQALVLQRRDGDDRLHDASGTQGVSCHPFGRRQRHAGWTEECVYRRGLRSIVCQGSGAVRIDIANLFRTDASGGESPAHRVLRSETVGVRRGHVPRVARLATTEKVDRGGCAFEKDEPCRLTDRDAVARSVKRTAHLAGQQLERVEAMQRRQAQTVRSAHNRGVDQTGLDPALRGKEDLGAGGARRRYDGDRSLDSQDLSQEAAQRVSGMRVPIAKIRRPSPGLNPLSIGNFRAANTRSARTQYETYAVSTDAVDCRVNGLSKVRVLQRHPSQAIQPAIPSLQRWGKSNILNTGYRADPAWQITPLERIGPQARFSERNCVP